MSILVVNQSVVDAFISLFCFLYIPDIKTTGFSVDSISDRFVCRFWLTRTPVWCMVITSTYTTLLMALSRYIAVIYPIYYKNVRTLLYCDCAIDL